MASAEHIERLNRGAEYWNSLRVWDLTPMPDLSGADLSGAQLAGADLGNTDLSGACLARTNLRGATLSGARIAGSELIGAQLQGAILIEANLCGANLAGARLDGANLRGAALRGARLDGATLEDASLAACDLREAVLSRAHLGRADLTGADLTGAELSGAVMHGTQLADVALSGASGLSSCNHFAPSALDRQTLWRNPDLPQAFLDGCGRPGRGGNWFIAHAAADAALARDLQAGLAAAGAAAWLWPEPKSGGWSAAERYGVSLRREDRLVVLCSDAGLAARPLVRGIERGIERAIALSLQGHAEPPLVLIRLDDALAEWNARIRALNPKAFDAPFMRWDHADASALAGARIIDLRADAGVDQTVAALLSAG